MRLAHNSFSPRYSAATERKPRKAPAGLRWTAPGMFLWPWTRIPRTSQPLREHFKLRMVVAPATVFWRSSGADTPGGLPTLKYCTYLGLNAQASVAGVAVDSAGNAFLAGFTSNPNGNMITTNGFQTPQVNGATLAAVRSMGL